MNAPRLVRTVLSWPVESQQHARRNALVASTALTRLRVERQEVEDFLAEHERRRTARAAAAAAPTHAAAADVI